MNQVALFWALLLGFLVVDNLVLVRGGSDVLRFGRAGRLRFHARARMHLLGAELIVLNPLNPFDRLLRSSLAAGPLLPQQLRPARRGLRAELPALNALAWLGSAYLLGLAALLLLSLRLPFVLVLGMMLALHGTAWLLASLLLLRHRERLGLEPWSCAALLAEALFVPGYTINLGKRIGYRRVLALPAFAYGLHELKRMPAGDGRELQALRMLERLDEMSFVLDLDNPRAGSQGASALQQWRREAKACLTTLASSSGC